MAARLLVASLLLLLAQARASQTALPPDPATELVRVRGFLTTTSTAVDIGMTGAEWANAISPDPTFRVIIDGPTVHVTRKTSGEADIELDLILGSVTAGTDITWTVTPVAPGTSSLDLYNMNAAAPRAVDRFDAGAGIGRFMTSADLLREGGPAPPVGAIKDHILLAFFYPWYNLGIWSTDRQIYDSPVPLYSTDDPADLQRIMTAAKGVGLAALVMSWPCRTTT